MGKFLKKEYLIEEGNPLKEIKKNKEAGWKFFLKDQWKGYRRMVVYFLFGFLCRLGGE